MYLVTKIFDFDAAHYLRNYEGKCKNMHGHTYKVEVTFAGNALNSTGMLLDFGFIKKIAQQQIVDVFDHTCLNDVADFAKINPTAEHMAKIFYDKFDAVLQSGPTDSSIFVERVRVWETPDSFAEYDGVTDDEEDGE